MLERLTIQNYALIESLDIEFPDGLVIMTGETGAGKSILLGAVSLLSGGKADPSVLRDNTRNCVVEAVFDVEGGQRILRRVISPAMRSRFFIDDEPVPASRMAEVSSALVDIHAQHSNLLLSHRSFQLDMIDGFCANKKLLDDYRAEYEAVRNLEEELGKLEQKISKAESDSSAIAEDLGKLEGANLEEGELEALELEQKQLENAQMLKENAGGAAAVLDGEDGSVVHNLKEVLRSVERLSSLVPKMEPLGSRLESCRIECKDIASDLQQFADGLSSSPMRMSQIEERLDLLYSLMRRFSRKDVSGLIALRDELRASAVDVDELMWEKKKLEKELDTHIRRRSELSSSLTSRRSAGAEKIQKILQESIRNLEMPSARISVELERTSDYTPDGADDPRILFTANPKEKMVELNKVASGGELSRIMLCIKSLMASHMKMPTMFFDEIDVGVSGSVADKMGRQIVSMGQNMQVIAITHLPQVASKGVAHIVVYKDTSEDGRNTVHLRYVKGHDRVMEIARLLSGEKTTDQAVANAKVLLGTDR
ncbi:MAG: DNA repair protein RecN [Bacteroidales bacterium]|nr:DNA repair protein RecN [Bacteroidales bacterium]